MHDCRLPPVPAPQGKLHMGFQAVSLTHQRMLLENQVMGWTWWGDPGSGVWGRFSGLSLQEKHPTFPKYPYVGKRSPTPTPCRTFTYSPE